MRRAMLCCLALSLGLARSSSAADAQVGEANTLWVVPERQIAWVEPLYARRKDGGKLYQLDGLVVQRDLADSVKNAITYLTEHPEDAPGWDRLWETHDLYFWWPDPDQPRGGPSAGVAFAVAAYSAMVERPVRRDVAFTGGIGPDGAVLPVGGLSLKIPAAIASGIKTLCLPAAVAPDPGTLPFNTARTIRLISMRSAGEAFFEAFGLEGLERDRYDRVSTLWRDAREAIAQRQPVPARLALDELCELAPNDLSAERLARSYQNVDLRIAAQNLFADAQKYDRDGLPDEALKTARRANSYADEATRKKYAAFLEQLERESLPPTSRALLDRAMERAAAGDLAEAYRLLTELAQREPGHSILHRLEPQRLAYGAVAKLEASVQGRPDDLPMHDALAQAYLKAGAPLRAVDIYGELRNRQPDESRWVLNQAAAWEAADRREMTAGLLRDAHRRWPEAAASSAKELGLELVPPELTVEQVEYPGNVVTARLHAKDGSGPTSVEAFLGDRPLARAEGSDLRLTADLGRIPPGDATLRIVATDPLGNTAELGIDLQGAAHAPPCVTTESGANSGEPATIPVRPGERWLVGPQTNLRIDAADWFRLPITTMAIANRPVSGPPWTSLWTAPATAGQEALTITGAGTDERPGGTLNVEVAAAAPVRWVSPAADTTVRGTVAVQVTADDAVAVQLWVDGLCWQGAEAGQPLLWPTNALPAGTHQLTAVVERQDGRRACSRQIQVEVESESTSTHLDEAPVWIGPVSLSALLGEAREPHPAVAAVAGRDAAWFAASPTAWTPLRLPEPGELAIRLPKPSPMDGRLELPPGQPLAFDERPTAVMLGGEAVNPGPLATWVWTPSRPGTWQFGELSVTQTSGAPLALVSPAPALRLNAPVRFELAIPPVAEFSVVSLMAGEAVWSTWSRPPAAIWLEPDKMAPGCYPLRLVAKRGDGQLAVSPAVVVEVE